MQAGGPSTTTANRAPQLCGALCCGQPGVLCYSQAAYYWKSYHHGVFLPVAGGRVYTVHRATPNGATTENGHPSVAQQPSSLQRI